MNSADFITFYKLYTSQRKFFEEFWRSGGAGSFKLECDGRRATLSINISSGSSPPVNEKTRKKRKPPSKVEKSRIRKEAWLERRREKPPAEDPLLTDVPAPLTTVDPSPAPDPAVDTPQHKHCSRECKYCFGENDRGSDTDSEERRCLRPCSETRPDRCCRCSLDNCKKCEIKRCLESLPPRRRPRKKKEKDPGPGKEDYIRQGWETMKTSPEMDCSSALLPKTIDLDLQTGVF